MLRGENLDPIRVLTGRVVVVWPAHPGAGSTTLALALAEAAALRVPARLVDTAAPTWSALVCAATTELAGSTGWRRGRRPTAARGAGAPSLTIDRVGLPALTPDEIPLPTADPRAEITVLDVGWGRREIEANPGWINLLQNDADLPARWGADTPPRRPDDPTLAHVVVCGLSPHALRQAEATLERLPPRATRVALVGAPRRGGDVLLDAGPLLRAARDRDAVRLVPRLPGRPVIGARPLPGRLLRFAERLLPELTGDAPNGAPAATGPPSPDTCPADQPPRPGGGPTERRESR